MRVKIIKLITWVAVLVGVVAITMLDSVSNIPMIVAFICSLWLLLIAIFNQEYLSKKYDKTI